MYLSWTGNAGVNASPVLASPLTFRRPVDVSFHTTKYQFFPCFKSILFLNKCFELLFPICSEMCPNFGKYVIISMTTI